VSIGSILNLAVPVIHKLTLMMLIGGMLIISWSYFSCSEKEKGMMLPITNTHMIIFSVALIVSKCI
jgi:hypothetical protein